MQRNARFGSFSSLLLQTKKSQETNNPWMPPQAFGDRPQWSWRYMLRHITSADAWLAACREQLSHNC